MKHLNFTLSVICFFFAFTIINAQDLWEDINLPDGLNAEITCFVSDGDEMFIGTNAGGVHYSNNKGKSWTNLSQKLMDQDNIQSIYLSPNGFIFVIGQSLIYRSPRKQFEWLVIYDFQRKQEMINCSDMSLEGDLAVGTDNGIYKSASVLNGTQWSNITGNLEKIKVTKVKFDAYLNPFICTIRKEQYSIYELSTRTWQEVIEGIKEEPIVNQFTFDENQAFFAVIANQIYQYDYKQRVWTALPPSGQKVIRKIKFSKRNLVSMSDFDIRIFDKEKNKWSDENEDLKFNDRLIDIIIDKEDKFIGITKSNIKISNFDITGILDWLQRTKFRVYDAKNTLMKNIKFNLYKGSCDNNSTFLTEVTTNSSGIFSIFLSDLGLSLGDQIKLERSVTSLNSVKTGHEAVDNRMYEIKLNNLKFDGNGQPSYYTISNSEYQDIKMDHTQLLFNLVISVEWDAKQEYLDTLKSWVKAMSNYLWDVTDGHLYIKKVAIYDNKQKWNQADIKIFVSNVVWPNASVGGIKLNDYYDAQVRMPRRWFGNADPSRNRTALNTWISESDNYWSRASSTTIAHELGHYLFGFYDEYVWVDTNKQKTLPAGYKFGFMQYQYSNGGPYSSEMSFPGRYSNDNWKYTAQWAWNGSDCWTQFEKDWEKTYVTSGGGFFCPIYKPSERTLSSGRDYLLGPLDFISNQNQCIIDPLMDIKIFNNSSSAGDVDITCIDDEGKKVTKAHTYYSLPSSLFPIVLSYQGQTSDDGKIKVLGATVGNMVAIQYTKKMYLPLFGYISFLSYKNYTITSVTGIDKEFEDKPLEEVIVQLDRVKGDFQFVNTWKFDQQGALNYHLFSKASLSNLPVLGVPDDQNNYKRLTTRYIDKSISFSANLGTSLLKEGTIQISLIDEAENPFFIPVHYIISERQDKLSAPLGSAEISIDPKNSEFRTIALLASDFFPITEGLVREPEHVGYVVSITSYPMDFSPNSNNILLMRYSKTDLILKDETSLKIHKWDENTRKWMVIPSTVDTSEQIVTGFINQNGTYALFTTDRTTGYDEMNENNYFGLKVTPNPISNEADVQFALNKPENVTLKVVDNFGRDVITVLSEFKDSGVHKYKVNTNSLSSGVYYFVLKSGLASSTVKAVIIK
ncbi:MAG: T9SS type A sorting domain-containing protein [Candidatus Kapabacteria bacterium]|nr:T9SS type A sorting domain-containing protein [Candidatus Kapabacteria bacterium]